MSTQAAYLIIDIGTGNVRVALTTPQGQILAIARENVQYRKDDLYPESIYFDPAALWDQILRLTAKVLPQAPGFSVRALTATSQREGIVLIDRQGKHLIGLPNIDHRGREWEGMIRDKSRMYLLTGRYPSSLFSALKLVGIRERRPEIWERTSTFLSISDWVQYLLCGVSAYEHSQASETLLYDVEGKRWSEELCEVFGLAPSMLPPLRDSATVLGAVLPEAAAALGIPAGAQVVCGGSDTQLAILSTEPSVEDVVIVSGTTTPVIKISPGYVTDPQERTWTSRHTTENEFILEANAGVTGLNYQRLKEIFYPNESYEVIEQELASVSRSQCVASLGSLIAGEKVPLTKGGFIFDAPVSHLLTRGSFVWATLWDIACSIKENYASLCQVSGHSGDYIWACGGGVQSPALRQFLASLLNKKILIRNTYRQSSVVGGAFCCNRALGEKGTPPLTSETVEPRDREYFLSLYEEWKKTRKTFQECYQNE